ncbi:MAG: hypothetical protein ACXW30_02545 [Micavibrio sp.]
MKINQFLYIFPSWLSDGAEAVANGRAKFRDLSQAADLAAFFVSITQPYEDTPNMEGYQHGDSGKKINKSSNPGSKSSPENLDQNLSQTGREGKEGIANK